MNKKLVKSFKKGWAKIADFSEAELLTLFEISQSFFTQKEEFRVRFAFASKEIQEAFLFIKKELIRNNKEINTNKKSSASKPKNLRYKFYVKGYTDAECISVLYQARQLPNDVIMEMVRGLSGRYNPIMQRTDYIFSKELDIAVGYRVWQERLLLKRQNELKEKKEIQNG